MPQLAKKCQYLASILFNVFAISCSIRSVRAGSHTAQPQAGEESMEDHMDSGKVVRLVPYSTSSSQVFFYNPYPYNSP